MRTSQCQVCGEHVSWRSLFDAKETTGVKVACINCIEKAARLEGAKAMKEACKEIAENEVAKRTANAEKASKGDQSWGLDTVQAENIQVNKAITAAIIAHRIAAIDPATAADPEACP